ncbi:putative glycosyltransferase [Tenacibaculum litopenaei]|uniref:exopolysaccharide biosynthesis polyprenyl glycosylphosphotransferase n=1 Tax=Tenacibaculum litopenaei TaxID=396016 RepID=UPI00389529C4
MLLDLSVLVGVVYFLNDLEHTSYKFLGYMLVFWVFSTLFTGYYRVFRYTSYYRVLGLLINQIILVVLGYYTYFSVFREGVLVGNQALFLSYFFTGLTAVKVVGVFLLKKYRTYGNNYRKIIVLGSDSSSRKFVRLIRKEKELGYQYCGFFSKQTKRSEDYMGVLEESFAYVLEHEIDEIYCSVTELTEKEIKKVTKFANENNRIVKLIPNTNELYNKNTVTEYYSNSTLVLRVKELPFELVENRLIKRVFDIVFSLLVCVFVLSWLYPLLFVLIKLESRGPAIFKQKREGLHGGEFVCYKFRSMYLNDVSDKEHARKGDERITKIGAFLRSTSLDEFPQFFNVLIGSMSVVGPRPHMNKQSDLFTKEVRNYMKRKSVKPGVTGLAQVSGYRGEITKKIDIDNRVRLDIFYIENWSLALDVKIIVQTMLNVFKGEEKAY